MNKCDAAKLHGVTSQATALFIHIAVKGKDVPVHSMKAQGEEEAQIHTFLTLTLQGSDPFTTGAKLMGGWADH
jgi:hypothetical protein